MREAVRAGRYRHRVNVQARGTGQDAAGGPADPWVSIATMVAADVEPLTSRELAAAQSTMPEATHQIRTRYTSIWADPKVAAQYRIDYLGRIFNLSPPRNVGERNVEVVILATEGLNDG